jgi:6-phosphogluconolactonase
MGHDDSCPFLFRPALHYFPMKMTRRLFAVSLLVAPLVFSVAGSSADKPAANHKYLVFVGTYTTKTESKGIYSFDFDADTGKLTPKGVAAETPDPSWVAVHPHGKYAYVANEAGKASMVSAFAVDTKGGKLTLLNQTSALGEDPCYLSFDKTGKYLLVANYSSGTVAVFPILADGRLGEHTALVKDQGVTGPNKERQEAPHAHWIEPSPDNRFVFVSDLGLDEILVYRFDAINGALTPNDPPFAKLDPGAGPRHAAFSSDGKFLYVLSELNSTITSFAYDSARGALKKLHVVTTLPVGFQGRNDAAEIVLHPDGNELLASNRGFDSIALFFVDPKGGIYGPSHFPNAGIEPRHFAIDPTGHFLLGESQKSNTIAVSRIDPPVFTFPLKKVSQVDNIPSPVCLVFLAVE